MTLYDEIKLGLEQAIAYNDGKTKEKDYCVHPGSIMKAILISMNKSLKWLAKEMGVNKKIIGNVLDENTSVTLDIAQAFEKATGYPAENLLYQQKRYELFQLK